MNRMDDLISRQAAIRWEKTECNPYKEDAADIVAMTYQQLLEEPEQEPSSYHHISSLYPDDTVYIKPDHKRSYSGFMYEKLTITLDAAQLCRLHGLYLVGEGKEGGQGGGRQ